MMTLKRISTITGFSISTVSKALNDSYEISAKTRRKIKIIADQNKYIPNKNALRLRKSKSDIIAVILPSIENALFVGTLSCIERTASRFGYKIMLLQTLKQRNEEKKLIEELSGGVVDGIIVLHQKRLVDQTQSNSETKLPIEYIEIHKSTASESNIDKTEEVSNFFNSIN